MESRSSQISDASDLRCRMPHGRLALPHGRLAVPHDGWPSLMTDGRASRRMAEPHGTWTRAYGTEPNGHDQSITVNNSQYDLNMAPWVHLPGTTWLRLPGYTRPVHSRTRTLQHVRTVELRCAMGSEKGVRNSQTDSEVNLGRTIWALAPV